MANLPESLFFSDPRPSSSSFGAGPSTSGANTCKTSDHDQGDPSSRAKILHLILDLNDYRTRERALYLLDKVRFYFRFVFPGSTHYIMFLIDRYMFDSGYDNGERTSTTSMVDVRCFISFINFPMISLSKQTVSKDIYLYFLFVIKDSQAHIIQMIFYI